MVVDYSGRSSFELRISRKVSSMTYRELLFKMSEKDMLTLSSDKDGRGLFWAGMNNMEALDREFDWKDFDGEPPLKKEYNIDKQGRKREI